MHKTKKAHIESVKIGPNPDLIVIILEYLYMPDTILTWSVKDNVELEVSIADKPYEILWDYNGSPYIVHENCVEMTQRRCKVDVFDYQKFEELKGSVTNDSIDNDKGQRFDGKNHNWMIFQEYLCLPFSYMTFVIKDKIERQDKHQEGNIFDPTPYNYVFNKSTSFLDGKTIFINKQLSYVLENFERINPIMLELLHYTQDIVKMTK